MGMLIRGGSVIDPLADTQAQLDVLIQDGVIVALAPGLDQGDHEIIDVAGLLIAPGLVDMHVHLCDPGQTHKEDLATGTAAAVHGGVTTVACMPSTVPPIDHPIVVEYIQSRAQQRASCRVYPIGAITKGLEGRELAPLGGLAASGVVGLSDDGATVANAKLLRQAMEYASAFDLLVIEHCEDADLSAGGVMHEGPWSTTLGLHGIPAAAEEIIVARDLLLAEATRTRLHLAQISTAGSVRLIREGKRRGVNVTAEVSPHHLVLTDERVQSFDSNLKTNPPLRTAEDVAALRAGLADSTIDVIASDHSPHARDEKQVEFDRAPVGVIGLETSLAVVLTSLVADGVLSLRQAVRAMSTTPASLLGVPGGRVAVGAPADLVVIDRDRRWTVDAEMFASKARNTPFQGWPLRGKAVLTLVAGRIKYSEQGERAQSLPFRVG
jgi:dihydroorotase